MLVYLCSQVHVLHVKSEDSSHALKKFQVKKVERSLTEVQPTSGMGKVHIRRKTQSIVMACALTPPRLPHK